MREIPLALTYDDVLIVPRFSSIKSRRDVDTTTRFTRQLTLKAPFVSANMDSVTESRMAIAMAEFGGIGVVHRFLPVEAQAEQVEQVKRHHRDVVEHPYTVPPSATVGEALRIMEGHDVHGLPVVAKDMKLVGIITRRDVQFAEEGLLVSERMTPVEQMVVASPNVTLEQARQTLSQRRLEKLPLVDGQGRLVGLITAKDLVRDPTLHDASRDGKGRLLVAAAVGAVGDYLERAQALVQAGADAVVVDISHGDSAHMLTAVSRLRERLGATPMVAGNVATAEGTKRLIEAGVDAVKVGVGPGSMCITREVAGVGVPQFTAVLESTEVAHKQGVPVIADGGIRKPADVAKAIGAGASTVMLGNLLAGTDESPGIVIRRDGRKVKIARGMASAEAQYDRAVREDPKRGWAMWEAGDVGAAAEGVQAPVAYRGGVRDVLSDLLAGLRSGMSYCDAANIEQMWRNAAFVRQTDAGRIESGPHDVGTF
ncbi:MAG: IMP dehydrogenase [SAR202 cluster bacterium]|nr:IMP dehydrogenase [SAR202 cluster bacterium]